MDTIEQRIRSIISGRLGLPAERVRPGARLAEDLGLDSLDTVQMAISLEAEFEVEIADKDVELVDTVADLVMLITRLMRERAAS